MKKLLPMLGVSMACLLAAQTSSAAALIGWQTFDNNGGNNNTGINDTTPDTNSTFDATPVGGASGNHYLTGAIGPSASTLGRRGRGQNTNNGFLNGPTFGLNENIVDYTLADGSPGARIGPQGQAGTSSWKFSTSDNERRGDFSITNHSDYFFRLEFIHFDARAGNANSPDNLQLVYLAGGSSNLLKGSDDTEFNDLVSIYNTENAALADFGTAPSVLNISRSLGAALSNAAYLAPGQSASFRFIWTGQGTNGAESQIDNLALEGNFFETSALTTSIDPLSVTASAVPVPASAWLFISALTGLFARKRLSK